MEAHTVHLTKTHQFLRFLTIHAILAILANRNSLNQSIRNLHKLLCYQVDIICKERASLANGSFRRTTSDGEWVHWPYMMTRVQRHWERHTLKFSYDYNSNASPSPSIMEHIEIGLHVVYNKWLFTLFGRTQFWFHSECFNLEFGDDRVIVNVWWSCKF